MFHASTDYFMVHFCIPICCIRSEKKWSDSIILYYRKHQKKTSPLYRFQIVYLTEWTHILLKQCELMKIACRLGFYSAEPHPSYPVSVSWG